MFFVGDDEGRSDARFPWVTLSIVAINVLVFVAQRQLGERFDMGYSLVPREVASGKDLVGLQDVQVKGVVNSRVQTRIVTLHHAEGPKPIWLTFVTSMFMHGDLAHLIANMWFLLVFGRSVEQALNPWRFLLFYLISGIAGSLMLVWEDPQSLIPCNGASGAISGVMGGYMAVHPLKRIKVLLFFWVVRIPALIILGLWFGDQWLAAEISASHGINVGVAYSVHLGGFLAGSALCWGAILYANLSEAFRKKEHPDFDVRAGMIINNEVPSNLATARFLEESRVRGDQESPRGAASNDRSDSAVTSLTYGLTGLFTWLLPIFGFPASLLGLKYGIRGCGSSRTGTAIVAIFLNLIALCLSLTNAWVGVYLAKNGQWPPIVHAMVAKMKGSDPKVMEGPVVIEGPVPVVLQPKR